MIWGAIRRCFVTETIVAGVVLLIGASLAALGFTQPWPTAVALAVIVGMCAWVYRQRYKRL